MGDACSVEVAQKCSGAAVSTGGNKSIHIVDISRPRKLNGRIPDLPGLNRVALDVKYKFCNQLAPKVTAVRHKITQSSFVAYQLPKDTHPCQDRQRRAQTITALTTLDHPNICQLVESFEDQRYTYLVYQAARGRPIFSQVARQRDFGEGDAAKVALQAVRALSVGYEKSIHHGHLAPKNLLLDGDGRLSITDFGLAGVLKPAPLDSANIDSATMAFLAPEVVKPWLWKTRKAAKGEQVKLFDGELLGSPRADVWSLGVIMYFLLSGTPPFKGKSNCELAQQISDSNLIVDFRMQELSRYARDFLIDTLTKDYKLRPSAAQLLEHPWLMMLKNAHTAKAVMPLHICRHLGTLHAETHFKKAMMRIIATKMTSSNIKELTNVFDSFDENRDGQITLAEFKEGLALHPELRGICGEIETVFAEIDHDQSGKISVSEFIAATLDSQAGLVDQVLWDTFTALDANENGVISREELRNAVHSVEGRLGRQHAELIASRLDQEVTASLSFDDFKGLLHEEGGRTRAQQQTARSEAAFRACGPACARAERAFREVIDARSRSAGGAREDGADAPVREAAAACQRGRGQPTKKVVVRTPSEEAVAVEDASEPSTCCPSSSSGESDSGSEHGGADSLGRRRTRRRPGSRRPCRP